MNLLYVANYWAILMLNVWTGGGQEEYITNVAWNLNVFLVHLAILK